MIFSGTKVSAINIVLLFFNPLFMCCFFYLREFANFVISRPGGGSDHQTGFRNGKLRRFAIGAVYHFFLWNGLSEKLEHFESINENFGINKSKFFIDFFHWKSSWKIEIFRSEKISIFFDLKIFHFHWIFNEKSMIFLISFFFVGRFKML